MLKHCEHCDGIKLNVKSGENFSHQCDKALWREATKRKPAHKESIPQISPESINRESSLWKIIFIDDSFLISLCPFTGDLSEDAKKSYIGHPLLSSRNLSEEHYSFFLYPTLDKLNHHVDKKKKIECFTQGI